MVRFSNRLLLAVSCLFLLTSCGGGDGGVSSATTDTNIAWVTITASQISHNVDGSPYVLLNGNAFINSEYVAHQCVGLCCVLCVYDNSYPGVTVSVINQTSGFNASATSRYGTATHFSHEWYAKPLLVPGDNTILVTAFDPAGNSATETLNVYYLQPAPANITITPGDTQLTLEWDNVSRAESYHIYWSTTPEVTKETGIKIADVSSPYIHTGLVNGNTYYYVVTSESSAGESNDSSEVSSIPGSPVHPAGVTATASGENIVVTWEPVNNASSYNIYWDNEAGVIRQTGNKLEGVLSPYMHQGLIGLGYYYRVSAENNYGESALSEEVFAIPELPPVAPEVIKATYGDAFSSGVLVVYKLLPSAYRYYLYRCDAEWDTTVEPPVMSSCTTEWIMIDYKTTIYSSSLLDWGSIEDVNITKGQGYRYHVIAENDFGKSEPSNEVAIEIPSDN
jgi:fibronectin type 3 domain-containing protein